MSEQRKHFGNQELRARLQELDEDEDITVTSWEAEFLETILHGTWANAFQLTNRQVETAEKILEKYGK